MVQSAEAEAALYYSSKLVAGGCINSMSTMMSVLVASYFNSMCVHTHNA